MARPRVAINGFGRIGRLVARALKEQPDEVELIAINDLSDAATLAHLFKHDTVHGRYPGEVSAEGDALRIDGERIEVLREADPARLPWKALGVDYVVESTGRFTSRSDLQKHLDAGARRVVLSAPGKDVDLTLVLGVNDAAYNPERHFIISNSSCTTNCLAPVLKVLNDAFTVKDALMTTVHAYTNDQALHDTPRKDLRRARAAATNFLPTSTGAASAIGEVIPPLAGKVDGIAIRVPVPNVSLIDLSANLGEDVTRERLAAAFHEAAQGPLRGILRCETRPLVSSDFNHDPASAIVDLAEIMVTGDRLVKVLAWYDNEWGYSSRTAELLVRLWQSEHGQILPRKAMPRPARAR